MAAFGLHHELSPMGDHLRRMKSKIRPAAAQTATAHKIAIIFYTMVKKQVEYCLLYTSTPSAKTLTSGLPE